MTTEAQASYLIRHPDRALEASRAWKKRNPIKVKIASYRYNKSRVYKTWHINNPNWVRLKGSRRRAKVRAGTVSPNIIEQLLLSQDNYCNYLWCNADLHFTGFHLDHIMPLALGGEHKDSNLQILCPSCNLSKHAKHPTKFFESLGHERCK